MPSKSKAQQRFMGMVHALNKGEMNPSDASPEVKKVAKSMKKKDAKDFASTKHKGKPNKVKQEWLKEMIKELVAQELNLEGTCGYGEDGELGDEPAGPHLLKIKKESFSELEAERYDKKLKSAIKRIAKKDRKKGLLLMNFYKKHWVEFMIKSKQALGESILNEGEKEKIEKLLIKYGNTPEDAKQMVSKTYDYIKKAYRNANASKKAEIMSGLMKFETTEHIVKLVEKCWKGYEKKGTKMMFGKRYPNCVKKEGVQTNVWLGENEIYYESNTGEYGGYSFDFQNEDLNEAEYQGRKVKLNKIMQGDAKKFKVYVKNQKGNVVKVNFGQGGKAKGGTMRIRKSNPQARKNFRARHNCDNPGPKYKARYWACRTW